MENPQVAALAALLRELSLPLGVVSLLLAHAKAVAQDAERLGLVSESDRDFVIPRHTGDSLLFALARPPRPGEHWVDVGSGAGFPGLVLSCCYPESSFDLIEPQRKRAGFLELQRARLGLENVEVLAVRAEGVPPGFDVAVARALAEPLLALEVLRRLRGPTGTSIVAVGESVTRPQDAVEIRLQRAGVDSPGRLFIIAEAPGGA